MDKYLHIEAYMKFYRGKKESPGERREEGKKWGSHRRHFNCFIWQRLRSFLPLFPSLSARLILSLVKLYVSDGGFYMVFFIQARPNKIMQHCRIGVQLVLYVCILLNGRGGASFISRASHIRPWQNTIQSP